jgi:hypothetical protein
VGGIVIEQAEVITSNTTDDQMRCDICGSTDEVVGTTFDTPTGYVCIDCVVDLTS